MTEKIKGKIGKRRWVHSHMSYIGRVLVLDNLVATLLWHHLTCVETPSGLLAQIQIEMVDFVWDGLHWVAQAVLFFSG